MGYTTNSPRVVVVVKHAIERCADIDINKPRVKHPTNGKRYHFDIVAVCKEWVAGERAYKEKIDNLTDVAEVTGCAERAAEVAAMKAERAPIDSCATLLTSVRKVLNDKCYAWAPDFTDPELHLRNIVKQREVAKAKAEKGYFIRNNEAEYAWADANVDNPNISIAELETALGTVGLFRGAELRDKSCVVTDGGVYKFKNGKTVYGLIMSKRAKGGLENHKGPSSVPFSRYIVGLNRYRDSFEPSKLERIQTKELSNFNSVLAFKQLAADYNEHFGANMTYHKVRQLGVARFYAMQYAHMPLMHQCLYAECVQQYLGHRSVKSSLAYTWIKHDPSLPIGTSRKQSWAAADLQKITAEMPEQEDDEWADEQQEFQEVEAVTPVVEPAEPVAPAAPEPIAPKEAPAPLAPAAPVEQAPPVAPMAPEQVSVPVAPIVPMASAPAPAPAPIAPVAPIESVSGKRKADALEARMDPYVFLRKLLECGLIDKERYEKSLDALVQKFVDSIAY